jgi:hypothetical protein
MVNKKKYINKGGYMKRFLTLSLLALLTFCFVQTESMASGLFFTNATYPVTATGVKVQDLSKLKKATVSTKNILYVVEVGNASIDKAVKEAGITKISYIDVNEKTIFIFFRKLTVNVYGE